MTDSEASKFRNIVDGILGDTGEKKQQEEPPPLPPAAALGGGAVMVIINGSGNHIGISATPATSEPITDKQRKWLRGLVNQIVEAEQARRPGLVAAAVWTQLNGVMGVTSYRDIQKPQFDRALHYLQGWLNNLRQP